MTRETKRKPLEIVRTFTTDLVMKAIKSCINSKAFGSDKLSIFHLKHLVPRAIEYNHNPLQSLDHNLSDSGYMEVIINHPYTETGQGHLPRNFLPANLVNLPNRKSQGISVLPTINKYLIPAQDQDGFRREHSTTSALLQLTTDVAVGFNQRKPPDRTVCVAVDLFDTVCHNNLLSKINRSHLPPATARWLSCYLRGRQAKTCFRGIKSTSRKVNTGVPQGSKLSPSLFRFYIADMPIPTDPVKRVCYADDLTVWASGVNIPDLEVSINNYLEEITAYLKDNSLLISAPKSSVTLLTPDTDKAKIHPSLFINNSHLSLVKCPKLLASIWTPPYHSTSTASMWQREYQIGTTSLRPLQVLHGDKKGNTTDDLQGSRQIDHQLRRTCLESKPT